MATKETTNNTKKKILFFDNEPFTVNSLTLHLKLFGWEVKLVPDIDELFHELYQNPSDIVILDIKAPEPKLKGKYVSFKPTEIDEMDDGMMTGVVLAKKIWEIDHNKFKDTPILFHSAKRNPIPEDEVLSNQNKRKKCDYIRKPQRIKSIHQKLQDMLNY